MHWYVVYTKPRNEKAVAKLLIGKGINVYCPLKEEIRQWSDRKKKVQEPVFRSYIFVALEDYTAQSVLVLQTKGVVKFLWWNRKPGVVRPVEIKAIQDFLNDYKDAVITTEIALGENVRITEGPLKDNTGVVLFTKGNKVYLRLNNIGLQMMATVPVQSVEKKDIA